MEGGGQRAETSGRREPESKDYRKEGAREQRLQEGGGQRAEITKLDVEEKTITRVEIPHRP